MVRLCRLCATQRKDHVLTEIRSEDSEICQQLRTICQVDVRLNDPLPKFVCGDCVVMTQSFFKFYTNVQRSQESLKTIMAMSKSDCAVVIETTVKEESAKTALTGDGVPNCAYVMQDVQELFGFKCDSGEDTVLTESNASDNPETAGKDIKAKVADHSLTASPSQLKSYSSVVDIKKRQHKCETCGRAFTCARVLQMHMRTHTGERPFQCSICNSAFAQKSTLRSHMKRHTGDRSFKCSVCECAFSRQSILRDHMKRHTGERPFKCTVCGSSFAEQSTLRTHMKRHTGERPYQCSICDSAFARQSILRDHMHRHTGERPYHCSMCDCAFAQQSTLRTHIKRHSGDRSHQCTICCRAFSMRTHLDTHMNRHTGVSQFKCSICDCAFADSNTLSGHMKEHTNESSLK